MGVGGADTSAGASAERFLNTSQTAAYLGLAAQTLREWRCAGRGPAYHRLGGGGLTGRCLYRLSDLEAYLQARRWTSTSEETVTAKQAGEGAL